MVVWIEQKRDHWRVSPLAPIHRLLRWLERTWWGLLSGTTPVALNCIPDIKTLPVWLGGFLLGGFLFCLLPGCDGDVIGQADHLVLQRFDLEQDRFPVPDAQHDWLTRQDHQDFFRHKDCCQVSMVIGGSSTEQSYHDDRGERFLLSSQQGANFAQVQPFIAVGTAAVVSGDAEVVGIGGVFINAQFIGQVPFASCGQFRAGSPVDYGYKFYGFVHLCCRFG
jgi:hypothetical protein